MSAYLESALSLEEYRQAKNKLVNQNQLLKEKLSAFEQKANNRFELTEKFLKYNMELANDRTNEENTHLFKKSVRTFKLRIEPYFLSHAERGKSFLNQSFLGECRTDGTSCRPYFWRKFEFRILAEAGGFEPPMRFPTYQFSKLAHSTTLPRLRCLPS